MRLCPQAFWMRVLYMPLVRLASTLSPSGARAPGSSLGRLRRRGALPCKMPTINFSSHGCFLPRVFTNTIHIMALDTPGT